jgi:transposase InsO family protein
MVGPAVKREGVAHLRATMGLSERRACSIVSADRKMVRYRSCRPPDTELRTQLRDLANERKRFGYRRLFVLLRQEGEPSGINRIYRLYREEGLTVRKRRARRRAVGSRAPILVESKPNARWSVDFVHDQLACGRRLRILNIVDDVTRECLAAIPDTSISGRRVTRELTALIERRGKPGMIVSDNGTEFTSNAMFAWAQDNRLVWHFIAPGSARAVSMASFSRKSLLPGSPDPLLTSWQGPRALLRATSRQHLVLDLLVAPHGSTHPPGPLEICVKRSQRDTRTQSSRIRLRSRRQTSRSLVSRSASRAVAYSASRGFRSVRCPQ